LNAAAVDTEKQEAASEPKIFQFGLGKILKMWYNDVHDPRVVPSELVHESLVGGTESSESGEYFEHHFADELKAIGKIFFVKGHPEKGAGDENGNLPGRRSSLFDTFEEVLGKQLTDDVP
jgi:hypothetical protein